MQWLEAELAKRNKLKDTRQRKDKLHYIFPLTTWEVMAWSECSPARCSWIKENKLQALISSPLILLKWKTNFNAST